MFDCCSVTFAFVPMAFEMDDVGANVTEVQRSSEPLNASQAMNAALTPGDALQAPALSAMPETEDPHSQCSLRCLLASSSQTSASANSKKSRTQAKTIMVRTVVACNQLCIFTPQRVFGLISTLEIKKIVIVTETTLQNHCSSVTRNGFLNRSGRKGQNFVTTLSMNN